MDWSKESVIVYGGSGFLGKYIVERLLGLNCGRVISFSRSGDDELRDKGVEIYKGDICCYDDVKSASAGCTAVIHTAAKAGVWGAEQLYYDINVNGTENVLNACRENGIKTLVYTSSPSVSYSPLENIENCNELLEYPRRFLASYPYTKALAEKRVLGYNWYDLSAVALRPHLIWGPRDPHLLPKVIQSAKKGKLKIVGNGGNIVDMTYVVNATEAHIKALEFLKNKKSFRKAYFISDDKPVRLWDWTNSLFNKLGIDEVTEKVSFRTAYFAGAIMEAVFKLLPLKCEPPMTRFVAGQLAFSHYFDISAAKKDFDYAPVVEPQVAMENTVKWLQSQGLNGS